MPIVSEGLDVLVVDDDFDTADSLATILRMCGHRVRVECNGFDAVAAARERAPDVAFLDIGLPGMNGFELATELKKLPGEKTPMLVAVSGYERCHCNNSGSDIDVYLLKPVHPQILCGLLKRLQEALV